MSTSQSIELADAVVAALNEADISMPFVAVRAYTPQFKLEDMGVLHVTVVPVARETVMANRGFAKNDIDVDIAIQKHIELESEVDALIGLVEEVEAVLRVARAAGSFHWLSSENAPIFSREHLLEYRQFTSVLRVTYTALKQ